MSKHEKQQTIQQKETFIICQLTGIHYPSTNIPSRHLINYNQLKTLFNVKTKRIPKSN